MNDVSKHESGWPDDVSMMTYDNARWTDIRFSY